MEANESNSSGVSKEIQPHLPSLTDEYLETMLYGIEYNPEHIDVDPHHYAVLHHTDVTFTNETYKLVYKISRTNPNHYITKLSLIEHDRFKIMNDQGLLTDRLTLNPDSVQSEDDFSLIPGEKAYRYLNFDLTSDPISVMSMVEVDEALRGQGLGSLFFKQYEPLAQDFLKRNPTSHGKTARLLVRSSSTPAGWTDSLAVKNGYTPVPEMDRVSGFPEYQKNISIE